jgi:hypothetical protein
MVAFQIKLEISSTLECELAGSFYEVLVSAAIPFEADAKNPSSRQLSQHFS